MVVDTGSDELWVNPSCNNIAGDDGTEERVCHDSGSYVPSSSSTSKQLHREHTIQYGKGSVNISYYNDTVAQVESGITLKDLQFGVARHSLDLYEGILGLGFSRNARYTTFVDAVAQQKAAGGTGRVFSIALGSANQPNAGTLVLGGLDTNRYTGALGALPILAPPAVEEGLLRYWVHLDSLGYTGHDPAAGSSKMSSKTYAYSSGRVVLDTGSSLSILPTAILKQLIDDMGVTQQARAEHVATSSGRATLYSVPCASVGLGPVASDKDNVAGTMRSVDFAFGNGAVQIRVPLSEFAIKDTGGACYLGAMATDGGSTASSPSLLPPPSSSPSSADGELENVMLLGAAFLRGAYVVFDQSANTIFMAPYALCNGGKPNLQPLASMPPGAAANITGACAAADSLANGAAGGIAAPTDESKNGAPRGSNPSIASLLLAATAPVLAMLLM